MSEIQWIKISTDLFDNRKIRQIEVLPNGDALVLVWIKLLCLAGNINDDGLIYVTPEMPYTPQMLATQFYRPEGLIQDAIKIFEQFGMIVENGEFLQIANWAKYQNIDRMTELREYNRLAQQKSREKRKAAKAEDQTKKGDNGIVNDNVNDLSMTCQCCQGTEKSRVDKSIYITTLSDADEKTPCPYQKIRELFNSTCVSFTPITAIEGNRKKTVAARWHKNDSFDAFAEVFRIAEASDYLKGQNDRNWKADFDWLMRADNFAKVREHKYDNRVSKPPNFAAYDLELVGQMLKTGE